MSKVQNDRTFSEPDRKNAPGGKTKNAVRLLICLIAIILAAANVSAATWTVTSASDSGPGTLREAVNAALTGDTIVFDRAVRTIVLSSGELVIRRTLTIEGAKGVTIMSNFSSRAFNIPFKAKLTLTQVALTQIQSGAGGAIFNAGTLNLNKVYIYENYSDNGGAIYSTGTLNVDNSTIAANKGSYTGGISIDVAANETRITNTTIARNRADFEGGGIALRGRVNFINHCTIRENTAADNSGGGLFTTTPNTFVSNTVLEGNQAYPYPELSGPLNSQGFNLIGNTYGNTGVLDISDLLGFAPGLGPLQINGGTTPTYAPLAQSPLIDAGDESNTTALDQTGAARLQGFSVDIGAFEYRQTAAQTIVVQNANDSGAGSLREAVNTILPNGVITFAPTVTLVNLATPILIQKRLIINGPGTNNLIIRGPLTTYGDGDMRVFSIAANVSARISKLSVNRSGINNDGTLFLSEVSLTQPFYNASYGVILSTGNLTLNNSVVADGKTPFKGGGIAVTAGKLVMNNSYIRNNKADWKTSTGGGIYLNGTGRINKSTIAANYTSDYLNWDYGGGIYIAGGNLSVVNSTFDGNVSYGSGTGNAIYAALNSSVFLLNCTITNNNGGIYPSSIKSNSNITLKNTLVSNNSDISGAIISGGNNFVSNSGGSSGFVTSDILNIKPDLSALGYYGGPTPTVQLIPPSTIVLSPINYGSNNFAPPTDQRGNYRFALGNAVDIGAYETP
jgi:predicted outer membrane repeat protein